MRIFILTLLLALTGTATLAETETRLTRSILVLDASGSMWGQIDGEAKITIAQRSIRELLEVLPEGEELGLVAYGHRRRGDCGDIEILVEPGPDGRDQVATAVDAIRPKGKTPLGDAVRRAAEVLRYQEETASVILVSDGLENCGVDPCALGRQLEADGIGFTAHVIGFDVSAPEDQAQLACLAEETGGQFLSAEDASTLSEALIEVSSAPEPVPEPAPVGVTFRAVEGEGGPEITGDLAWFVTEDGQDTPLVQGEVSARLDRDLMPGRYTVEVLRPSDEEAAVREIDIAGTEPMTVTLILPVVVPEASLDVPPDAVVDETIPVGWDGPGDPRDFITVSRPDQDGYETFVYIEEGNPAPLQTPAEPGTYEVRYVANEGRQVLARAPLEVTDVPAALEGPPSASVGASVQVGWEGPARDRDYISIATTDAQAGHYESYVYIADGNPVTLTAPGEPGRYEVRYILAEGPRVLASADLEVTEATAGLTVPPTAEAGSVLSVGWQGPGHKGDYVTVADPGQDGGSYVNYTYTREGNPLDLIMPAEPGRYEIRYILDEGRRIMAAAPIEVVAAGASLDVPPSASAGGVIDVAWTGPANDRDYISVAAVGAPDGRYESYTYTRDGTPLTLQMPADPGAYEIRYVLSEGPKVLVSTPITVEAVTADLAVPPSAEVGAMLSVTWDGPDFDRDFITVAKPDAADGAYEEYTYTREGSPLDLQMPVEPGAYEIRYVQTVGDRALARVPLQLVDVEAQLDAPASATAGGTVQVVWSGPGYGRDYVSIAQPGTPDGRYETYTYTREGPTLTLELPDTPGEYELRYILGSGPRAIARRSLVVE